MSRRTRGGTKGETSPATEQTPAAPITAETQTPAETTEAAPETEKAPEAPVVETPAPEAEPEAPAPEPEAPVTEPEPVTESAPVDPHAKRSPLVRTLLTHFDDYLAHMDSSVNPTDEHGVALQRRLLDVFTSTIKLETAEEFIDAMNYMVSVIRTARGPRRAFNENWLFRFFDLKPFPAKRQRVAEGVFMFMLSLADGFKAQALQAAIVGLTSLGAFEDTELNRLKSYAARSTTR